MRTSLRLDCRSVAAATPRRRLQVRRRRVLTLVVSVLFQTALLPMRADQPVVRVGARSAPLRAAPNLDAEIVREADHSEILQPSGLKQGDWLEVEAPAGTMVWAYGKFIKDGIVDVPKLPVRAGPGITFRQVATLAIGDIVAVKSTHGAWTCIEAPTGCRLWVNIEDVAGSGQGEADLLPGEKVDAEQSKPADKTEVIAAQKVTPKDSDRVPDPAKAVPSRPWKSGTAVPAVKTRIPESMAVSHSKTQIHPPADSTAARGAGSAAGEPSVTRKGVLRPSVRLIRSPARYRLVEYDAKGRTTTICYVRGDEVRLDELIGRTVEVAGAESRVTGVRQPVIDAEQIAPQD